MTIIAYPSLSHSGPTTGDEDLLGPAGIGRLFGGADDATFNPAAGTYEFSGTKDELVYFGWQLSHGTDKSRPLDPHIHILHTTAAGGSNSRWRLQLNYAPIGSETVADYESFDYDEIITVASPAAITANKALHSIAHFPLLTIAGVTYSTLVNGVLSRLASSDAADDDTAMIPVGSCDMHFKKVRLGHTI